LKSANPDTGGTILAFIKVLAAAALALVLWQMISAALIPPAAPQEPPRRPELIPAPTTIATAMTTTPTMTPRRATDSGPHREAEQHGFNELAHSMNPDHLTARDGF